MSTLIVILALLTNMVHAISSISTRSLPAEYHFQVCEANVPTIIEKMKDLNLDLDVTKKMDIFYFDDTALGLYRQNLIIRLRKKENKNELTLKYRGKNTLRRNDYGDCEWDVYRQDKLLSCTAKKVLTDSEAELLLKQPESFRSLLDSEQENFLKQNQVNLEGINLRSFGPVDVNKFVFSVDWAIEEWKYDSQVSIIEISLRGTDVNMSINYKRLLLKLKSVGLNICPTELKKTKFTIDYFLNRNH